MKKILFVAMVALAAMACKPDGADEIQLPEPDKGVTYLLEGVIDTEGFEWSNNAIIGLYSMNTAVKAANLECKIEGWVAPVLPGEDEEEGGETEGGEEAVTPAMFLAGEAVPSNAKRFVTPAMDLVKGENKFMVYYPYDKTLTYVMGTIYNLNVSASQVQTVPNVAAECFSLGTAVGTPKVDETFKFVMNPITALAQVKITSTEFANYGVKKVTIWNNDNVAISGGFNVNVNNMTFENLPNATPHKAAVTVNAPALFSAVKTQNIYVNLLPSDLTGKEMWLLVELEGSEGNVVLPIKKEGVKFEAGKTTVIELSNLSMADNAAGEWYVPTEKRLLGGLGYAYGEANTYLIQCKNGQTYTNGTYTPNADIPNEVKIDIRPRGNFAEVVDPKGATFEWFRYGAQTIPGQGTGTVWGQTTSRAAQVANPVADGAFTFEYDGNYTVTVKNNSAYAGAPILLMIKDGKVLWAWYFWNISADGTTLEGIDIGNGMRLANMFIGQNTMQFADWGSNQQWDTSKKIYIDGKYMPGFAYVAYYQWGRYMPVSTWTHWWSVDDSTNNESGVMPAYRTTTGVTMKEALARPVGMIIQPWTYPTGMGPDPNNPDVQVTNKSSQDLPNWLSEPYGDLWGNDANGTGKTDMVGTKSIYDPCPKGWRVADMAAFDYIIENKALFTFYEDNDPVYKAAPGALYNGNLHMLSPGYSFGKTATNGRMQTEGGADSHSNKSYCTLANTWSNLAPGATGAQPYAFLHGTIATKDSRFKRGTFNRTSAFPVRCQVDTDNR